MVTTSAYPVVSLASASQIQITSVDGISMPAGETSYPLIYPLFTFGSIIPVQVNVSATNIPTGTVPEIYVTSIVTGATQSVACSALQGTLGSSTCTAAITFPPGGSFGYVKANWSQ